jgi:hypothetical protein
MNGIQIGDVFPTRDGDVVISSITQWDQIRVCFIEYPCEIVTRSEQIRNGKIKNPMKPVVAGVGFIGVGSHIGYVNKKHTRSYRVWHNMLTRTYNPQSDNQLRNYSDVVVNPSWHNFQNFAEWYFKQINPNNSVDFEWHLDKDLLFPGNKIYSEDYCCLIPQPINVLFTDHAHRRGDYPLGVTKYRNKYMACVNMFGKQKHLGYHFTIRSAQIAYWSAKFEAIRNAAIMYWNYLPEPLAMRLLNFGWEDAFAYYGDDSLLVSD